MTSLQRPRARDIGVPFSGKPGPLNAITDVAGIEVGYVTLTSGEGRLVVGEGPVRTGVTAILPRGRNDRRAVFGASFSLNGPGEVTGLTWLEERGLFDGPILITNTHSVGVVRDAAVQWMRERGWNFEWTMPIAAETYDGNFSDINGGHVRAEHVFQALDSAQGGPVAEGNVGGGTGMTTYEYKGGTGTASGRLSEEDGGFVVGVLVQSNYGRRRQLRIAGLKMGEALDADMPRYLDESIVPDEVKARHPRWSPTWRPTRPEDGSETPADGSIIVVVATDAPLLPHQLKRLAKRPSLAIGRLGGVAMAMSGDIFVALSTANAEASEAAACKIDMHPNLELTALFEAAIDATEEAILNALVASEASTGAYGLHFPRLPHDRVRELLKKHNLLVE
jgi:L-aminopeptidase/D-esterase-like protein